MREAEALANQLDKPVVTAPPAKAEVLLAPEVIHSIPSPVNDVMDTVNSLESKIMHAMVNQEYFVETTEEVFNHFMRGQKTAYFIYKGIRVYKYGTRDDIERDETKSI